MVPSLCLWLSQITLAGIEVPLPSAEAEVPKPLMTLSVKLEGASRTDVHWMEFIPSSKLLAVRCAHPRSRDAMLKLFDVHSGKDTLSVDIVGGAPGLGLRPSCAISPGGNWIAYGEGNDLRFLAVPPHKPDLPGNGKLPMLPAAGAARVWLRDKGTTAFVDRGDTETCQLEKWDLTANTRRPLISVLGSDVSILAVALNPAAGQLAVCLDSIEGKKPRLEYWTLTEKPTKITTPLTVHAQGLAISRDGKLTAAGFRDGTVAWYDTTTGKMIQHVPAFARFTIGSVAFHPNGKYLSCGAFDNGGPNLFMIDTTSGEILHKIAADPNGVTAVCFSPTGERLAAFGASGAVTIWDATKLLKLERD